METSYISWNHQIDEIEGIYFDDEGEEVTTTSTDEYVLIEKIYVEESQRGQGIARSMMLEALKEIAAAHPGLPVRLAALPLDKSTDGNRLVGFYEECGFEVISTEGPSVMMER